MESGCARKIREHILPFSQIQHSRAFGPRPIEEWRANIHGMPLSIPFIHPNIMTAYIDCIDFKLSVYENLKDTPSMLELAIWKSKIDEQCGRNNDLLTTEMKMQCRTNSITMNQIVVPDVMNSLTDGDDNPGGLERQWKRSRGWAMIPYWIRPWF